MFIMKRNENKQTNINYFPNDLKISNENVDNWENIYRTIR